MDASLCWQCSGLVSGALFCGHCGALQSPPTDYYAIFSLPRQLSLNTADLQKHFYELSRKLHPDRYTQKPPRERDYSLEATALLNDAYRVLRDPLARAEYVLKQHGFDVGEQRSKDVPPELLEEVFELNMALEELRGGDQDARSSLEQAREKFLIMRNEIDTQLDPLFTKFDASQDTKVLQQIRGILNRRRYIRNLVSDVEKELALTGR